MAKKKQTKEDKEAAPTKTEIAIHCKYDKLVDPKNLKPHPANPWKHPDSQIDLLAKIMAKPDIGIRHEIIVSKTSGFIVEGHCRREAAIKLNIKEYPVVYQEFESEATERAVMLNDNKIAEFAEVDGLIMADNLVELDQLNYPLEFTAMSEDEIKNYIEGPTELQENITPDEARKTLKDRFIVPPFSVLDARQGYWQDRKRAWLALGIRSELGRGEGVWVESESGSPLDGQAGYKASPGGSPLDEASLGKNGKTIRGDGRGRPITLGAIPPNQATKLSPDYKKKNLTWVKGNRKDADLDETSRKILAAGRKSPARCFGQDLMRGENKNFGNKKKAVAIHDHEWQRDKLGKVQAVESASGTSIFDPVLCELIYKWFCPKDGSILDPFAGGSVRGVVAAWLGYKYTGVELRPEQIIENEKQLVEIKEKYK